MPAALISPVCSLELLPLAQALDVPTAALLFSALWGYLFKQRNCLRLGQHNKVNALPVLGLGSSSSCPQRHAPGTAEMLVVFQMPARCHSKARHRSKLPSLPHHSPHRAHCLSLPPPVGSLLLHGTGTRPQRDNCPLQLFCNALFFVVPSWVYFPVERHGMRSQGIVTYQYCSNLPHVFPVRGRLTMQGWKGRW